MKRYYSLYKEESTANVYIYGDITSYPFFEGDVSNYNLSKELQELGDVDNINVYINSYGGEVAEGLAIYNSLKRHKAHITTIVDGFACSIASVIFSAGDERIMSDTSLLMIHNAWTSVSGNANDFKKQAADLEKVTQASINVYMSNVNIEEDELKQLLDNETWLSGSEAVEMGFATDVIVENNKQVASQSVRNEVIKQMLHKGESIVQVKAPKLSISSDVDVNNLVDNIVKGLQKSMNIEQEVPQQNTKQENKPVNMMRVLFNFKED